MKRIGQRVVEIITKEIEVDPGVVSEGSDLEELGIDSPHLLELAVAIEEEFDIEVPDADLAQFRVVSDIITYIEENGGA